MRDPAEQRLQTAERRLADFLATLAEREGVTVETEQLVRFEPVVFDAALADRIQAAAQRRGLPHRRMTSGAGHDAQMLARIAPIGHDFLCPAAAVSATTRVSTPTMTSWPWVPRCCWMWCKTACVGSDRPPIASVFLFPTQKAPPCCF